MCKILICNTNFIVKGVNLANIIMGLEEDSEIVKALGSLKDLTLEGSEALLIKTCHTLESECAKGMAEKVVCTKHDGYKVLVQTLKTIPVSCHLVSLLLIST